MDDKTRFNTIKEQIKTDTNPIDLLVSILSHEPKFKECNTYNVELLIDSLIRKIHFTDKRKSNKFLDIRVDKLYHLPNQILRVIVNQTNITVNYEDSNELSVILGRGSFDDNFMDNILSLKDKCIKDFRKSVNNLSDKEPHIRNAIILRREDVKHMLSLLLVLDDIDFSTERYNTFDVCYESQEQLMECLLKANNLMKTLF